MLESKLKMLDEFDNNDVLNRVNYYCKLNSIESLPETALTVQDFLQEHNWGYYDLDLFEFLKYFPANKQFVFLPGDITTVPITPAIVKSRPISEHNNNSVLMKLNKRRHYVFLTDQKSFQSKKNMLVWRGTCDYPPRKEFIEKFVNHKLCNVCNFSDPHYTSETREKMGGGYLSIDEQLEYKFILSLEGVDVATNLQWIMSSNSLCFARKHKYETWFMEGTLIPNYHYVLIKDDYSDLIEKITYYTQHTDEALAIIKHAHEYIEPFKNEKLEELISLLVLQKYFEHIQSIDETHHQANNLKTQVNSSLSDEE